MTAARRAVLESLADAVQRAQAKRVAVDGVDAAGKTTLAGKLTALLRARGFRVRRISVDDFRRSSAERYARGRESPEGYYLDSFDHDALREAVLRPGDEDVVLCEGVFLLRPELADLWHFSIFVAVEPDESLCRGTSRDGAETRRLYERRYLPGQQLYLDAVQPARRADAVVVNDDPHAPELRV